MIYKYEIKFEDLASPHIQLRDKEFELRFKYNERFDFITVEVYINNEFNHSTKLVYGSDIFKNMNLSTTPLIPFSELNLSLSNIQNIAVNKANFGDSAFLMYEDGSNE